MVYVLRLFGMLLAVLDIDSRHGAINPSENVKSETMAAPVRSVRVCVYVRRNGRVFR